MVRKEVRYFGRTLPEKEVRLISRYLSIIEFGDEGQKKSRKEQRDNRRRSAGNNNVPLLCAPVEETNDFNVIEL